MGARKREVTEGGKSIRIRLRGAAEWKYLPRPFREGATRGASSALHWDTTRQFWALIRKNDKGRAFESEERGGNKKGQIILGKRREKKAGGNAIQLTTGKALQPDRS